MFAMATTGNLYQGGGQEVFLFAQLLEHVFALFAVTAVRPDGFDGVKNVGRFVCPEMDTKKTCLVVP